MHAVVEMEEFIKCSEKIGMTDDERFDLISYLADNPDAGDEIKGTGGMRKLRVAGKGKGKSGGYRVITFFSGENIPVFLISAYAKNQKENINAQDKKYYKQIACAIVEAYGRIKS